MMSSPRFVPNLTYPVLHLHMALLALCLLLMLWQTPILDRPTLLALGSPKEIETAARICARSAHITIATLVQSEGTGTTKMGVSLVGSGALNSHGELAHEMAGSRGIVTGQADLVRLMGKDRRSLLPAFQALDSHPRWHSLEFHLRRQHFPLEIQTTR